MPDDIAAVRVANGVIISSCQRLLAHLRAADADAAEREIKPPPGAELHVAAGTPCADQSHALLH
jgi:hypothetical protein